MKLPLVVLMSLFAFCPSQAAQDERFVEIAFARGQKPLDKRHICCMAKRKREFE
jgi:hypothetical protein